MAVNENDLQRRLEDLERAQRGNRNRGAGFTERRSSRWLVIGGLLFLTGVVVGTNCETIVPPNSPVREAGKRASNFAGNVGTQLKEGTGKALEDAGKGLQGKEEKKKK